MRAHTHARTHLYRILNCGKLAHEFGGHLLGRNASVVGGELVAAQAKGTDPEIGLAIHLAKGIEDGATCAFAAKHGLVEDGGKVRAFYAHMHMQTHIYMHTHMHTHMYKSAVAVSMESGS